MSQKITVRWEASDGYVGGSRFTVDADDFYGCETDDEIRERLEEYTQDEFENRVTWSIRNESEVIDAIKAELAELAKEQKP